MINKKLILGTVQFGLDYGINNSLGKPDKEKVFEMLEYAEEEGIKILDTADAYGNATQLLGEFNKKKPEIFLYNTKFKAGKQSLHAQLANSRRLLNTLSINTYFYHSFDDYTQYPNLKEELSVLKSEGSIKYVGISIYDNEEFRKAINDPLIDVIQLPFNVFDNKHQRAALMSLAKQHGKQLQLRSVFLQGLFFKQAEELTGKLKSLRPYLITLKNIAENYQLDIEHIALLYALQQEEIDYVIIGVDNLNQLKNNLSVCRNKLSPDIINEINQIKVKETELLYPKNWN